ncbi:MAG: DUF423 domain-containing protein [Sediminibacterium sp.]|nr:DUF423 domain-containing protein [Sediminibacterium sp.]
MHNRLLAVAAILAAITVAMGALGAHALKQVLSETQLHSYDTAVKYQLFHALALFCVGLLHGQMPALNTKPVVNCMLLGILLFGGSIYTILAMESRNIAIPVFFRLITPLGGFAYISAWLILAYQLFRLGKKVEN